MGLAKGIIADSPIYSVIGYPKTVKLINALIPTLGNMLFQKLFISNKAFTFSLIPNAMNCFRFSTKKTAICSIRTVNPIKTLVYSTLYQLWFAINNIFRT